MKKVKLTSGQRYTIAQLYKSKASITYIAKVIEKDKSVVSREIKRNSGKRGYSAKQAQENADERQKWRFHPRKFTDSMRRIIKNKLIEEQWSPEQIRGDCLKNGVPMCSIERIYQFIRADKMQGGVLYKQLRHKLKHRARPIGGHSNIKGRVSIEQRPDIVEQKGRCGDWEIDLIIGADHKGAILTLAERKTQFIFIKRLPKGKEAVPLADVLIDLLRPYKQVVHTITSDNGSEFADHKRIAQKLNADFFFAHPYSSWERGLSEYSNKLIRQYIPKKANFDDYSTEDLMNIQKKLNRRPRKSLNFETPLNVFAKYLT